MEIPEQNWIEFVLDTQNYFQENLIKYKIKVLFIS
jgi:hypothetical protein